MSNSCPRIIPAASARHGLHQLAVQCGELRGIELHHLPVVGHQTVDFALDIAGLRVDGGGMKGGGGASSLGGGGSTTSGGGGGFLISSITLVSIGARTTSMTFFARPVTRA